jgi:hypothetical protein
MDGEIGLVDDSTDKGNPAANTSSPTIAGSPKDATLYTTLKLRNCNKAKSLPLNDTDWNKLAK